MIDFVDDVPLDPEGKYYVPQKYDALLLESVSLKILEFMKDFKFYYHIIFL